LISNVPQFLPILIGGFLVVGCLYGAFYNFRRKRLIDDTPTSKTQGVFIGVAELKGSAESERPFTAQLSSGLCVLYNWEVLEHWQRTVTETFRDAQGHTQTRTRKESGWKKVADGGEMAPFYLKDDSGVIRILPEGAKVQSMVTFDKTFRRDNSFYFGKGPQSEISDSTHQRRFVERSLPLHVQLYVLGQARLRQDVVAAEIAEDESCPLFLISIRSEKQILGGYDGGLWGFFAAGMVISLGATIWRSAAILQSPPFDTRALVLAALIYLAVFGLLWTWVAFNSLINLHHRVEQAWSQVDVQLIRRYDLIPNLIEVITGYRIHEQETQSLLAAMRSQVEATPPGVNGPDFKGLAALLRITVERYPELKANETFLRLQQSLVETEQRVALARDYYNDTTTFYNTRLSIVPDRFVASLARLRAATLMGAAEFERAPVKVDLSS
jgi:hypothetical protein